MNTFIMEGFKDELMKLASAFADDWTKTKLAKEAGLSVLREESKKGLKKYKQRKYV